MVARLRWAGAHNKVTRNESSHDLKAKCNYVQLQQQHNDSDVQHKIVAGAPHMLHILDNISHLFMLIKVIHGCSKCRSLNYHDSQIFRRWTECKKKFLTVLWPLVLKYSVGNWELPRPVYGPRTIDVIDVRWCRLQSYKWQQSVLINVSRDKPTFDND